MLQNFLCKKRVVTKKIGFCSKFEKFRPILCLFFTMSSSSSKSNRILQHQFGLFILQAEIHLSALCSECPPDSPSAAFNVACDGLAVMSQHSPKLVIDAVMNWRLSHKEPKNVDDKQKLDAPELVAAAKLSGVLSTSSGVSKVCM
jgi:hypothetical protein